MKRLTLTNLVAILIAIVLFAVGIMLWVIHEQRLEAAEQVALPGRVITPAAVAARHEDKSSYSQSPVKIG
jgi:hypothetical protein